jgi:hypothetical protein
VGPRGLTDALSLFARLLVLDPDVGGGGPQQVAGWHGRFFPSTRTAVLPQVLGGARADEPFDGWG